jgi:hypothetical protein
MIFEIYFNFLLENIYNLLDILFIINNYLYMNYSILLNIE